MSLLQVQLNDELLEELRQTAQNQSTNIENLIETAIKSYLHRQTPVRQYSFIGIGQSGKHRLSEQVEDILAESVHRQEGWSLPK